MSAFVALILNPSSANSLATSRAAALSGSATLINNVPESGRDVR